MKQIFIYLALIILIFSKDASAFTIIRDQEIENSLQALANPILKAANFSGKVKFYLVKDPEINAFATKGNNIFVNSGLITKFSTPEALLAVLAHEIAHIAHHDVYQGEKELQNARFSMITSLVLGSLFALSGSPDAAIAVYAGGAHITERKFLAFSRTQESAADASGINYLNYAGYPVSGFLTLFNELQNIHGHKTKGISQYALTHPLTNLRIDFIKANQSYIKSVLPLVIDNYKRLYTKVLGYLGPEKAVEKFIINENGEMKEYTQAILSFRQHQYVKAKAKVEMLVRLYPENPYYYEFLAQIQLETAQGKVACDNFQKAMRKTIGLKSLLELEYAACVLNFASKNPVVMKEQVLEAHHILLKTALSDVDKPLTYRFLASSSGLIGDKALSYYFLALQTAYEGKTIDSKRYAQIAITNLKDPLKIEEMQQLIKNLEKNRR